MREVLGMGCGVWDVVTWLPGQNFLKPDLETSLIFFRDGADDY